MSVFTALTQFDLQDFLAQYSVGTLTAFRPTQGGVVNTNYYVDTTTGHYVLTLFEQLTAGELQYFVDLNQYLLNRAYPCAAYVAGYDQAFIYQLHGKPAILSRCLPGRQRLNIQLDDCYVAGSLLAKLHLCSADFKGERANPNGVSWCNSAAKTVQQYLSKKDVQLLNTILQGIEQLPWAQLSRGFIHADFFPDNVLFDEQNHPGVIDFYFGCTDANLLDLAVALIAWCQNEPGQYDVAKHEAFVSGYLSENPSLKNELCYLTLMLQVASMRFWLSRLIDFYQPQQGEQIEVKDPDVMKQLLLFHHAALATNKT